MVRNGGWERIEPYLWARRHQTQTGEWTRRFYVRFRDWKKKLRCFSAGTDLKSARKKKKRFLGENEQGVDFDKGKVERFTFDQWADRYLKLTATKRTARDDRFLLKVLRPEFGALPLEEITYARIKEFALKLRQTPGKIHPDRLQTPATCNRKLALLRHILRMAWKEGLIEKLPAVELFPEDNERDRVLTEEEFSRLYSEAAEHLKPILLCAWETGMRRGEILGLTWAKVNLRENLITLESEDTKTKRRRIIPISGRVREMLLTLRKRKSKVTDIQQYIFLGETEKRVINIQHSFDGAVTRAGLKDVHFHDLRRSFVTRKVTEGWDRDHVKAITGHRTDKVFARYNKPSLETLRAVVEGTFNTSCVTSVSHRPGLAPSTVLSARKDSMEEDGARWPHRSSNQNTTSERKSRAGAQLARTPRFSLSFLLCILVAAHHSCCSNLLKTHRLLANSWQTERGPMYSGNYGSHSSLGIHSCPVVLIGL